MGIELNFLDGARYTLVTDNETGLILSMTSKTGRAFPVPGSVAPFGGLFGIPEAISPSTVTHVARSGAGAVAVLFKDGTLAAIPNLGDPFDVESVQDDWVQVIDGCNAVPDNRTGGIEPDPATGIAYSTTSAGLLVVTFTSGAQATWARDEGWR
jgi:hypothetical protein